ncbi:MFS transporter [Streptomyces cadmiisoli]|uniref:MFS transporter n=1 Tax=Streptomyces cadmiisoli TaxID=2184053 RepID=UPI00365F3AFF
MTGRAGCLRRPRAARPNGIDRRLVAPLLVGSALNPVNSSMLAVALIPIGHAFGVPPSQTAWLVSGLYLATAVGQPVVGRLVDAFGPRRLYLAGTTTVGVAGLLGALAPNLWVLVASRVLLGFGTSAAFPASMSLLRSESERTGLKGPGGVLAALSISNQAIVVAGPPLGGLLVGAGGWQAIFAINVPLSLVCLVLGALWLPRTVPSKGTIRTDAAGMLLFAGSLTAFMFFLMDPVARHWYLPVLGLAAGAVFVRRELGAGDPFIDLRVLGGNAPLLATFVRQLLAHTTSYALIYGYTQWLQDGRGLNPAQSGLLVLPMSATAIVVTVLTGRRGRVRAKLLVGAAAQLLTCSALFMLTDRTPLWLLVVICAVAGIPQGLIGLANQNALYEQADPARMGSSAGLLRTFMYLGALLASAAIAAFFRDGATSGALHGLAWLLVGVAGVFLVVCLADRSTALTSPDASPVDPDGPPQGDGPLPMTAERPISPWDLPAGHPGVSFLTGPTALFALTRDPRFSYCLYVPKHHRPDGPPRPLLVAVHGTRRRVETLRDAFAGFAERHDCVVLAPLFPAGITGPNDVDSYKLLSPAGFRSDEVLLDMVEEAAARWHVRTDRFHLHGFSGGGQFAHRFAYLHPDRLASLSVGAPGHVTLLEPTTTWWQGTADTDEQFGITTDPAALRDLPIQLIIGELDTGTAELPPHAARESAPAPGSRTDRIHALRENWIAHGIDARLDTVPGTGHDHIAVLPAVQKFLAAHLAP